MATSRAVRRLAGLFTSTIVGVGLLAGPVGGGTAGAAALVPAANGAKITKEQWLDKSTVDLTVSSPALGAAEKVRMIVPKGWSRTAKRTWPVLHAYHGGRDHYESWTRSTNIKGLAAKWGVIVVMPESGWPGAFANHHNYGKGGTPKWETFHTAEVIQLTERNYRAGTARAAMGISSGATGSMRYAARHKGLFRYAAAYSGVLHTRAPGIQALTMATLTALGDGTDPFSVWGVPGLHEANWKALNPYDLAPKLKGVKLHVSSGTTGEPGPLDTGGTPEQIIGGYLLGSPSEKMTGETSKAFVARLKALKIPVTSNIYGDGWHQWLYWQREMHAVWKPMMKTIGAVPVA